MRVTDRLRHIYGKFAESPDSPRNSVFQFVMVVFHCVRLKVACTSSSIFDRLVASQTITSRFRNTHTELAFLERELDSDALKFDWEAQCESDERALLEFFGEQLASNPAIETKENHVETATLLVRKVYTRGDTGSWCLLDLLKVSLVQVQEVSGAAIPTVLQWFIPSHELDIAQPGERRQKSSVESGRTQLLPSPFIKNAATTSSR